MDDIVEVMGMKARAASNEHVLESISVGFLGLKS